MNISEEDAALLRRISDIIALSHKQHKVRQTSFLNEHEQASALSFLERSGSAYRFFGGYKDAKRAVLAVCNDEEISDEDFSICALTFSYRPSDELTHRDFLGSLMALGITRESVGDIIVSKGGAVVFCTAAVMPLIKDEITKIGRVGVTIEQGVNIDLPEQQYEDLILTVSSLRLDCVIAAASGKSRENAAKIITSKLVSVNSFENDNVSCILRENDIITIRGTGKFLFKEIIGKTKKDKSRILLKKYL